MAGAYPEVRWDKYHIDILRALRAFSLLLSRWSSPPTCSAIVLFDLGPACTGFDRHPRRH